MSERRRLRVTTDYIIEGPELSEDDQLKVAMEVSSLGQTIAFQDLKDIEVVYIPAQFRVVYAHYHSSDEEGSYCRNGCLDQAQDTHNQEDI